MTQEQILQLTAKKHIKIWKLHKLGLSNKEVAGLLGTGAGHVYNVVKDYNSKPDKASTAESL